MGRHGERVRLGDQLILVRDGPDAARSTEFCTRILVAHCNQNSSWSAQRVSQFYGPLTIILRGQSTQRPSGSPPSSGINVSMRLDDSS